jgi:hypothetical protein
MINHKSTSDNKHPKDFNQSELEAEFNRVIQQFRIKPQSMLMAAKALNIERSHICWYCRDLRLMNAVNYRRRERCSISNHWAYFISTDLEKYPIITNRQFELDL